MKLLRIFIWLLGILILGAVMAGSFFIYEMNPNDYKPQITELAKDRDINLVIDGDLSWSFFPSLSVRTADVSMSGMDIPSIRFDEANFSLDWLAILGKTIRLKAVTVKNANIVIKATEEQDNNPSDPPLIAEEKLNNFDSLDLPFELDIANLNVKNSKLTMIDVNQKSIELDEINFSGRDINIDDNVFSATISLSGLLKMDGVTDLPTKVDLDAEYDINNHHVELKTFSSDIGSTKLEGNLIANDLRGKATVGGSISVINNSMHELPFENIPEELKKFAIQMNFSLSKKSIAINNITSSLNDFILTGDASLKLEGQRELKISLTGSNLNFPTSITKNSVTEIKNTRINEKNQDQVIFLAPIFTPLSYLHGGKGHIEINLDSLTFDQIKVKNIHLNLFSNKEIIEIADLSGEIFHGTFKLNSRINTSDSNSIIFTHKFTDLDIKNILIYLSDYSDIEGLFTADFNGISRGVTKNELIENMNASGNINAKNLKFNKFNFEKSYCDMAAIIEKRSFSEFKWPNYTEVRNFESKFLLKKQIVTIPNFTSGIGNLSVRGDGNVNLSDQSYNFVLKAKLDGEKTSKNGCPIKSKSIRNKDMPLRCKGSFDDGSVLCLPDKEFINHILKKKIKEKLFDNLLNSKLSESIGNQSGDDVETKPKDIKEQVIDGLLKGIFK